MVGWIVFAVGLVVVLAVGWFLLRRLTRWNDPRADTPEGQAEAALWTQHMGDGGMP